MKKQLKKLKKENKSLIKQLDDAQANSLNFKIGNMRLRKSLDEKAKELKEIVIRQRELIRLNMDLHEDYFSNKVTELDVESDNLLKRYEYLF